MKYDAFISYRHLERDMYVAQKVHKTLETIVIPKKIQKETGRKKINRVFRDQEELPIGSDLGSNIEAALKQAGFLIVICSPKTQESYWVMKEVDTFIEMHGREKILTVLVDGEPGESFPPQLLVDENGNPVEPFAADVRGISKHEVKKKLRTEILRIAAAILQVDYDDLKQRHRERLLRRNAAIAAGIAAVTFIFGAFTAYNLVKINAEYKQKLINESKVLSKTSLDILDTGDCETAALLAMEGLPSKGNKRPFVPDAMLALSQALGTYSVGEYLEYDCVLKHNVNVQSYRERLNGDYVVSTDEENAFYLWDLKTGKCLFKQRYKLDNNKTSKINSVGFCGGVIVIVTEKSVCGYNADGGVIYETPIEGDIESANVDIYERYVQVTSSINNKSYNTILDGETGVIIVNDENRVESPYSGGAAFSFDGNYAVISHETSGKSISNYITIINIENGATVDVPISHDSILSLDISEDGAVLVDSLDSKDLKVDYDAKQYLDKIELSTGEIVWSREFEYSSSVLDESKSTVGSAIVEYDEDYMFSDKKSDYAFITGPKVVYVVDLYTGDTVSSFTTDDYIKQCRISKNNGMLMVGTIDGQVNCYDASTGEIYPINLLTITQPLLDFYFTNAVAVVMADRNPNLILMKYHDGNDVFAKTVLDDAYYYDAASSPSGDTYTIVGESADGITHNIFVVETITGEQIGFCKAGKSSIGGLFYIDEDTVADITDDGEIYYYSIKNNKVDLFKATDDKIMKTAISSNNKYAIFIVEKSYYVVEIAEKKIISEGTCDGGIVSASISDNASFICFTKEDGTGEIISLKDNKSKSLLDDYVVNRFVIAPGNDRVAAVCDDGFIRIVDLDKERILDEIQYHGIDNYIEFSQDGRLLYLQSSDLYFQIYDLKAEKIRFISDKQFLNIVRISYDEKNNRLAVFDEFRMYMIDLNTFGVLNCVDFGVLYIPEKNIIVSVAFDTVKEFKFKSLDELIEDAHKKFGNGKLSDIEKLKYQIN